MAQFDHSVDTMEQAPNPDSSSVAQTSMRLDTLNRNTNLVPFSLRQSPDNTVYNTGQVFTGPEFSSPSPSRPIYPSTTTFTPPQGVPASSPGIGGRSNADEGTFSGLGCDERVEIYRSERKDREQRRRDDERGGFARLRERLPNCPRRSCKAVVIECAVARIDELNERNALVEQKLRIYEALNLANQHSSVVAPQESFYASSQSSDGSGTYNDINAFISELSSAHKRV